MQFVFEIPSITFCCLHRVKLPPPPLLLLLVSLLLHVLITKSAPNLYSQRTSTVQRNSISSRNGLFGILETKTIRMCMWLCGVGHVCVQQTALTTTMQNRMAFSKKNINCISNRYRFSLSNTQPFRWIERKNENGSFT